jgi:hypothetical protein
MMTRLHSRLRRFDLHLLLTLALCLFSLWPLATRPGLPNGTDVLYHAYRVAEMDRLWGQGVFIPSWAESFYTGYGAPLFHYYAGLSYYLTSVFARLFGTSSLDSLRLLIAVSMLGGAAGMYLFIQPRAGQLGGALAALSFTYSPYILFTEPYARGAYPEMAALALCPVIFWRYQRLLQTGSARAFVLAALSSGALILTHNLMAIVMTGLLGGWLVWEAAIRFLRLGTRYQVSGASDQVSGASGQVPGASDKLPATSYQLPAISHQLSAIDYRPFAALLTGLLLTAYFWLPVLREGDAVRLANLTGVAGVPELDYRNFFVPLGDLLAFSPRPDAGAVNGLEHRLHLGVMQWLLALAGTGVCLWWLVQRQPTKPSTQYSVLSTEYRVLSTEGNPSPHHSSLIPNAASLVTRYSSLSSLYFALVGLVCIFLMLPEAGAIWGLARQFSFLQFPWRLLGPAAFCLAVMGGMVGRLWSSQFTVPSTEYPVLSTEYSVSSTQHPVPSTQGVVRSTQHSVPSTQYSTSSTQHSVPSTQHSVPITQDVVRGTLYAVVCTLIIVTAAPTLYADEWEHETLDTSVAAYHAAELTGRQRATTFTNEYLPSTVLVEPGPTPRLLADYADGYPVNKAHLESLPPGVGVTLLDHGPQHDAWLVTAPAPFQMEVLTYYFPGWAATVNGTPVVITPSEPHGLITLPVPAGDSQVRLELGSTPPRDLGRALSLFGVVVLGVGAVGIRWKASANGQQPAALKAAFAPPYGSVMAFLASALLLFILMRPGGAWIESPPGAAWSAQVQARYNLGESLVLLGYDLNGNTFRPGDRVRLNLYWWARAAVPHGYAVFVHIIQGGPPVAQADKLNPAGRPTVNWSPEAGFIKDDYVITLPETLAPGTYQITVGMYTCETRPAGDCGNGDRPPVTDAEGNPVGDAVPLATIRVQ